MYRAVIAKKMLEDTSHKKSTLEVSKLHWISESMCKLLDLDNTIRKGKACIRTLQSAWNKSNMDPLF